MNGLERAIAFATEAHSGQVDKLGEPYIDHCLRVMDAVSEPAKRVAVLHDVVEDTTLGLLIVADKLRLLLHERAALSFLTRTGRWSYGQYIDNIAAADGRAGRLAREVKVADLRDNLGRWVPWLGDGLRKRYERALARLTTEETT